MTDNKVVIKINYDKNRQRKALIDPKMVTVWHTERILGAIAVLIIVIALLVFGLSGNDENPPAKALEPVAETVLNPAQTNASTEPVFNSVQTHEQDLTKPSSIVKRPAAIILNKRVIRAALTAEPSKDEPGAPIEFPVIIQPNQSLEVFYFTEIKNMKDKVLWHHWFRNGQLVYKKSLVLKTNKSKFISSKKLSVKEAGEWRVVLMDTQGKSLSEVNFFVNP